MTLQELRTHLENSFTLDNWKKIIIDHFAVTNLFEATQAIVLPANNLATAAFELGNIETADERVLGFYHVELTDNVWLDRNRISLRKLLRDVYKQDVDAAIIAFSQNDKWRLSYVSEIKSLDEGGLIQTHETQPKRFTFLLGEGEQAFTAAQRLEKLTNLSHLNLADIQDAFSVEKMSKAFFNEYKEHYQNFVQYLTGKRMVKQGGKWVEEVKSEPHAFLSSHFKGNEKEARDFCKKLLGRIVFLYFVQRKKWLGASDTAYKDGDENFIMNLFTASGGGEDFYTNWLSPLFFDTLNTPRPSDLFTLPNGSQVSIPFLNGGLFDEENPNYRFLTFPPAYFSNVNDTETPNKRGFLDFLNAYNFTIHEDGPDEQTVAVDPEMLGHIFENLLEDNKDKGAFYTPKEIVHYMCQESLIQYLKTSLEQNQQWPNEPKEAKILENGLQRFIRYKEAGAVSDYDETLTRALKDVKICDPAIGSGAFPMGLLNELYYSLIVLHEHSPDMVERVWQMNDWQAEVVKKNIIQHSIYGVDIDAGAVDIARLRFWLSLVVDLDMPEALPNFEYKIVVGDSLVSRVDDEVVEIQWENSVNNALNDEAKKLKELEENRTKALNKLVKKQAEFFNIIGAEKEKLKVEIRQMKLDVLIAQNAVNRANYIYQNPIVQTVFPTPAEIKKNAEIQLKTAGFNNLNSKLQAYKKNNKPFVHFDWGLDFPDVLNPVFTDKVGFDIVIGNPPYVQLQKMGEYTDTLQNLGFKTFARTGDIYMLFYEIGTQLLTDNGVLVFITSSQWEKAAYGKVLKDFFMQKNPLKLINLGPGVFDSATVDTNIMVLQNQNFKSKALGISISDLSGVVSINEEEMIELSRIQEGDWTITSFEKHSINQKILEIGKPLRDWDLKINFGIKTGLNSVFILNDDYYNNLIKEHSSSKKVLKTLLRGRELDSYHTSWQGSYLVSLFPALKLDISDYPAIESYLSGFLPKLKQVGETFINENGEKEKTRKKTGNKWFETQDQIGYYKEFLKEKIIWKRIGSDLRFCYSSEEIYSLDSTCLATGEKVKYLTGLLNSKVCKYFLHQYSPKTGMGDLIISVQALEPLPVYYPNENQQREIESLVDEIIAKIQSNENYQDLERKIDSLVFKLYNLSYQEVLTVLGDEPFWMSQAEYEALVV
ncbi:MAG: Eco57I restriction-modification methylase domain-containing protein [Bacteroidetes bacterium]|nr:Eco57I restriction-modification methylase domain-containing protein [Bacteroidota bacterium]